MRYINYIVSFLLLLTFFGCQKVEQKGPGPDPEEVTLIPLENFLDPSRAFHELPTRNCGDVEINPETGETIRTPNVDLVISHVEIFSTDLGTWVRPTIKNKCSDPAEGELAILIRSDSDIDVGLITSSRVNISGHSEVEWGYALGVPEGTSYTVIANWGNSIPEANYRNNRCVRSTTGDCR